MSRERHDHTLQATALVNEAYVRLIDGPRVDWQNRSHFLGVAAQLMRRILVDHARRRRYAKRGGGAVRVTLDEVSDKLPADGVPELNVQGVDLIALDQALTRLAALDPRKSRIVEMRFFAGMRIEEIAAALNVSPRTVKRDLTISRT